MTDADSGHQVVVFSVSVFILSSQHRGTARAAWNRGSYHAGFHICWHFSFGYGSSVLYVSSCGFSMANNGMVGAQPSCADGVSRACCW